MDWFLYDRELRQERVKYKTEKKTETQAKFAKWSNSEWASRYVPNIDKQCVLINAQIGRRIGKNFQNL